MIITLYGIEQHKQESYIASFAQQAQQYNIHSIQVGFDPYVSSFKRMCVEANLEKENNAIFFSSAVAIDLKEISTSPDKVELKLPSAKFGHKKFIPLYPTHAEQVLELAKFNADEAVKLLQIGEEEETPEDEELEDSKNIPLIEYKSLKDWVSHYKI